MLDQMNFLRSTKYTNKRKTIIFLVPLWSTHQTPDNPKTPNVINIWNYLNIKTQIFSVRMGVVLSMKALDKICCTWWGFWLKFIQFVYSVTGSL